MNAPELQSMLEQLVDKKLDERLGDMEARLEDALAALSKNQGDADKCTLVVFSGDFDKLMSAFIIATGAVAMGLEVTMYFTFWGLTALRKKTVYKGKGAPEKMIATMLPKSPEASTTSNMNMSGIGPKFFQWQMKRKNVASLPELIQLAGDMGVTMIGCQMAMDVMGVVEDELMDGIELGGVARYIGDAAESKITLFI